MKKLHENFTKKYLLLGILGVLVVFIGLFLLFDGVNDTKRIYYGYKSRVALSDENKKLGDPLKALGFTDTEGGNSVCEYIEKANYEGRPLDCTAELKSYQEFSDDSAKNKAISASESLSESLKQNGWQQGNYEVGKWFKDVLNGVDYNPDAYHYKYFGNTFCVLDFFVAYSSPKPPAVNAMFRCTVPETHPPIY